jgi:hypothetical protein
MYYLEMEEQISLLSHVGERERRYSKREVDLAKRALTLQQALGYPSTSSLMQALKCGNFDNVGVTVQDVARAQDIYGPSVAELKGKATRPRDARTESFSPPVITGGTTRLSFDIMFIDGMMWLVCVLDKIGLVTTYFIPDKRDRTIHEGLRRTLAMMDKYHWKCGLRNFSAAGFPLRKRKIFRAILKRSPQSKF